MPKKKPVRRNRRTDDNEPERAPLTIPDPAELPDSPTSAIDLYADHDGATLSDWVGPSLLRKAPPSEPIPGIPLLVALLRKPRLYRACLGMLLSGASVQSAFGCAGIPARAVRSWCEKGAAHLIEDRDSYLAAFAADVMRYRCHALADAEAVAKSKHVLRWLRAQSSGDAFADLSPTDPRDIRAEDLLDSPERLAADDDGANVINSTLVTAAFQQLHDLGLIDHPERLTDLARLQERGQQRTIDAS